MPLFQITRTLKSPDDKYDKIPVGWNLCFLAGGGVNAFEGTGLAGGDSALSSGGGVNSFLYGKSRGRGPVKKKSIINMAFSK